MTVAYNSSQLDTDQTKSAAGYYTEPNFSSFTFPSSINPNDSSNWINLGDNSFLIDGPVKFTDIAKFLQDASGQQVVNYSLDNLFVTADNANITLSPEANFLKPHKVSEFLGANFGASIASGPYGSYHALPQVLVSEGGYGNDAVNLNNPAGDGVVRVLAANIMPNNGASVTEDSRFVSFTIDTTAPAGKWIKYRIKCWNVLYETIVSTWQQNIWPLEDFAKSIEGIDYISGTSKPSNFRLLTGMSKVYASLANRSTNSLILLGEYPGIPGTGVFGFSNSREFLLTTTSNAGITKEWWMFLDPNQDSGSLIDFNDYGIEWVALGRDIYLLALLNHLSLGPQAEINLHICNYSNALSVGLQNNACATRIVYDLIARASFYGTIHTGTNLNLNWTNVDGATLNPLPIYSNGSSLPVPDSAIRPALNSSRLDHSLEINSTNEIADIDNLHTVLEYGYYDYSSNNAQSHASLQGRNGYYFQEGLAYIQPGSNGVNKATARIYFKDNCFPEGNLQIFADNITDFALTKVDDSPGNYGIVSGQALLNLQDVQNFVQTNETLTEPQVAEKDTAKAIWEKLYYENESYYVNEQNLQHIQDFENNIKSPSNENWCHLRTANYVDVNGQIKQDMLSQYQDDIFRAYYDNITLSSAPSAPTRSYYESKYGSGRKLFPDVVFDNKKVSSNFFPADQYVDHFIVTYEYDIPVKYKNFVDQALNYVNCLIHSGFTMHITIKKMPQDQQSQGVLIDSYIDTENGSFQIVQAHEFYGQDTFNTASRAFIFINPDLLDTAGIENVGYYQSPQDPNLYKYDLLNRFSMLITREIFSIIGLRGDVDGYGWNNQYNIRVDDVDDSGQIYKNYGTSGIQTYRFENGWKRTNDDNTSVIIDHGSNEFTFQHNYDKKLVYNQITSSIPFDLLLSDNNSIKLKFNTAPTNQDEIRITNSFTIMYHWILLNSNGLLNTSTVLGGIAINSNLKYLSEVPFFVFSSSTMTSYKYEISSEEMNLTTNQSIDISYITMGLLLDLGFSLHTVTADALNSSNFLDLFYLDNDQLKSSNALIDKWNDYDDELWLSRPVVV